MITFSYVEDYLEYIAGYRTPGGQLSNNWFSSVYSPMVSLARYDVRIVRSMSTQTLQGTALTDRQAELAVKIISKYARQLAHQNIDTGPLDNPQFRMSLRNIDRQCRAWSGQKVYLQFPYNVDLIEQIRQIRSQAQGSIDFNRTTKVWELGLTEFNVNFAYQFAFQNHFEIDSSLEQAMQDILAVERQGYQIQLQSTDSGLAITNAAPSLLEYIKQRIGGFDEAKLASLIDSAPVLGYTVNQNLIDRAQTRFGSVLTQLMNNKDTRLALPSGTTKDNLERVFDQLVAYARFSGRWPIFIHEPMPHTLSTSIKSLLTNYASNAEIVWADKIKKLKNLDSCVKFVYISKKISVDDEVPVPLLVTTIGMYFGGRKQLLLQQAEKVVYFTAEVYNKLDREAQEIIIDLENTI